MNKRLEKMKGWGGLPFDIDFLRELGIEIGSDWDGEVIIKYPDDIPERMRNLIEEFEDGIKTRLHHEGIHAKECFVGGPLNGKGFYDYRMRNGVYCHHLARGEWAVYKIRSPDDPRAWFMGMATSKKKGRLLQLKK